MKHNKNHVLKVKAIQKNSGHLKAPATGKMDRIIKESIDSEIEIALSDRKENTLFTTKGTHAGMELIDKILTYF